MAQLPATPKEVVLALIAQQNPNLPAVLDATQLYFGAARTNSDGTSTLPTTAMLGGLWRGYQNFTYKRLNLSQIYDVAPIVSDVGGPTLHSMLDIVNKNLGTNFTTDDVVDTNVAYVNAGEQVNINVVATPGSVGYTGSFFFRFIRLRITFTNAVKTTELAALVYPGHPTISKHNLSMMMWNHDFSADIASLKLRGNTWASQSAVATLMQDFGITDWPAPVVNGVTDYATVNYPGANTNFQRVTVQKTVSGSTYAGDALFHYNPS